MTPMPADLTPEGEALAKISGALAVLEHRRGSALIPAACAERSACIVLLCASPVAPITGQRHCRDVRTAVRAGRLNPTESQLSVSGAEPCAATFRRPPTAVAAQATAMLDSHRRSMLSSRTWLAPRLATESCTGPWFRRRSLSRYTKLADNQLPHACVQALMQCRPRGLDSVCSRDIAQPGCRNPCQQHSSNSFPAVVSVLHKSMCTEWYQR